MWGSVGCSLIVFFQFMAMNASALFLTAFTVERYIAICHPMKAQVIENLVSIQIDPTGNVQYICTMTRAKRIILTCWIFALVYSSPWLVLTHIKSSFVKGFGMVTLKIKETVFLHLLM